MSDIFGFTGNNQFNDQDEDAIVDRISLDNLYDRKHKIEQFI